MSRASDYGKLIGSIFNWTVRIALDLVTLLVIIYGVAMLYKLISSKGQMPMTIDQSIPVWGAIFLVFGFVAAVIICTIIFFSWPKLLKGKKQQTIETVTRRYNRRFKKLEDEIALLKKPAGSSTTKKPAKR